jgi:EAL domain-containing protein (putative c-di-GMP-specific phosphodiesterase class I)
MYQAKGAGRHGYQFFKAAMTARAAERRAIETSLQRALQLHEFALHYQPKVNVKTGEIIGAESLIRWTDPVCGPIAPRVFLAVAEDCGLIRSIGRWVLGEACRQARSWHDAGLFLPTVGVNISAVEFRDEHFLSGILTALTETGLAAHCLEVALAESVLMTHTSSTETIIRALRNEGVQVALDNFGTGYFSLSALRAFPISTLKMDQSIIGQITTPPDPTSLVSAVISMGQRLDLRIVAEGVETQEQRDFLEAHHCHEAQGYYFSPALPPEQFATLFRQDQRIIRASTGT